MGGKGAGSKSHTFIFTCKHFQVVRGIKYCSQNSAFIYKGKLPTVQNVDTGNTTPVLEVFLEKKFKQPSKEKKVVFFAA